MIIALFTLLTNVHAKPTAEGEPARKPATSERREIFDGNVQYEVEHSDGSRANIYRIYDPQHKVVCYTMNTSVPLTCVPTK